MKILVTLALLVVPALAYANRSLELTSLDALIALDEAPPQLDGLKSALTAVNEHALPFLPTAATLRAENAVAAVSLHVAR